MSDITTTRLLDPVWEQFALHSRGGLLYTLFQSDVSTIDLSQFVERYSITESIREVARVFDFTLDVADMPEPYRCHEGSDVVLWGNAIDRTSGALRNAALFSGKVYTAGRQEQADRSIRTFRAYDFLTVLARTEDILVYTDQTMTQIVQDVCARYSIPMGTIVDTEVPVGQIVQGSGTSVAQVIEEAAQRTLRKGGRKFFIRCTDDNAHLELLELGNTGVQWDLGDHNSSVFVSFEQERSAENLRTAVELATEQTSDNVRFDVLGQKFDPADALTLTFGTLRTVISPDNTTNAPSNDEQLAAEYAVRNRIIDTATTKNLILPGARQGDRVILHLDATGSQILTAYIATVVSEHTAGEPMQTLELVFEALGTLT